MLVLPQRLDVLPRRRQHLLRRHPDGDQPRARDSLGGPLRGGESVRHGAVLRTIRPAAHRLCRVVASVALGAARTQPVTVAECVTDVGDADSIGRDNDTGAGHPGTEPRIGDTSTDAVVPVAPLR